MAFKIIYEPKGRAREYADLALNIYTGCSFGCTYCFSPMVLKKDRKEFHRNIKVRDKLLEQVEKDCERSLFEDRRVHLCFTCDPYQDIDMELQTTREVLKLFKKYNVNFQILTKGGTRAIRDFDLYKPGDNFGTTLTFVDWTIPGYNNSIRYEPRAALPTDRIEAIKKAKNAGIKTWVSLEPVINPDNALSLIHFTHEFVDLYKVGKLNTDNCQGSEHCEELKQIERTIDWKNFGERAEAILKRYGKEYYIKEDLRKEMVLCATR